MPLVSHGSFTLQPFSQVSLSLLPLHLPFLPVNLFLFSPFWDCFCCGCHLQTCHSRPIDTLDGSNDPTQEWNESRMERNNDFCVKFSFPLKTFLGLTRERKSHRSSLFHSFLSRIKSNFFRFNFVNDQLHICIWKGWENGREIELIRVQTKWSSMAKADETNPWARRKTRRDG